MRYVKFLILAVLFAACRGGRTSSAEAAGDSVTFKYATQLSIVRYDGYTVASLKNPWKEGMTLHRYVLVPSDRDLPPHLPNGTIIRTPVSRAVMFTTVHCAMMMEFGKQDCISGVADLKYIKIPWVQQGVKDGRISDVGDGMSPVIEKIIDQRPDVLFLSPFENSGGYGKLEEINIPIVECAEYMEPSPLGRAEWVRFYGMLYGCENEADSLFAIVDSSYQALKHQTSDIRHHLSTLLDKVTGSVWYVPGGRSTIGQMLADAGADYPWAKDEHSGSVALPFETVLERAGECDIWLLRYSGKEKLTRQQLLSEHRGYNQFRSYREGRVYGCNVEQSLFYEESPFRPDLLLSDFIRILYPDALPHHELRYYHLVE